MMVMIWQWPWWSCSKRTMTIMIVLLNNWWWCCCWCLWYLCCFLEHDLRHILKSPPATFWYCQRSPEWNSNQPLLLMIIIDIERERAYFLLSLCIIIKKIMMGPGLSGRTPRWHPELHGNSWWNVDRDRVADNPLILMITVMLMTMMMVITDNGYPAYSHHDKIPPWCQ